MTPSVFLDAPNLGTTEKRFVNIALDSNYVSSAGPHVRKFEEGLSDFLGTDNAVATNSGTAALHVALHHLGVGPGDEVILPMLSFIATINPVLYLGAKPVLVDVEAMSWNIDPDAIEKAITPKTKVILPVHLYGNPCDMTRIGEIADKYGLLVVEDAAESLGAKYNGRHTGTTGDFGCFSFNGNKIITTGGGGAVIGRDLKQLNRIKYLVNQARNHNPESNHLEVGFNYKMTNVAAALGLGQMERIGRLLAQKRLINKIYKEELSRIAGVRFQQVHELAESTFWFTAIITDSEKKRIKIEKSLHNKKIPTRRIFKPLQFFPPYETFEHTETGSALKIYKRGLCLPSSTLNRKSDIRFICNVIKESV